MGFKKYNEYSLNEELFGNDILIYDCVDSDDSKEIYAKSKIIKCNCPGCGKMSDSLHSTYHRRIQVMPINMKTAWLNLNAYKFDCFNEECDRKVFTQSFNFVSDYQVKSDELISVIMAISIFLSNEGASKILNMIGIKASNDCIKRLYDKLIIEDDPDIKAIGVDDVSTRKGQKYATAIYDSEDHHLIALLEGRDGKAFKDWLKDHKHIKRISRDRASAYANAINDVLPECIQIADRFHLLQNLIDRFKEIFKSELPEEICFLDDVLLDSKISKQTTDKHIEEKILKKFDYDDTPPTDENGNILKYDDRLVDYRSKQYLDQAKSRKKNRN